MYRIFIVLSAILLLASCNMQKGYDLSGKIEGLDDADIYLQQRVDKEYVSLDSVRSADGTFEFTGTVEIPDVYYLFIPGKRGRAMIFLENSPITVSTHADTIWKTEISGSDVHDEYIALDEQIDAVYDRVNQLWEEYKQADANGDTAVANELEAQMNEVYEEAGDIQKNYFEEHPSSYIAPYLVQSLHYGKEADEIEEMLSKLDPELEATTIVRSMRKRVGVLKKVAVNMPAPDFTLPDPEGNPISLSSLRGNYLLVDFWAAWCGPCRRENPNVVEAYDKYHDKGFDILGVSLDDSREDWLKAIETDRLTWHHVSDIKGWSNEAAQLYGISSIPSNLLLNPEGTIIDKNLRGEDLHDKLAELLTP